jgi:hypothetical protein
MKFPLDPVIGQIAASAQGKRWKWNGYAWAKTSSIPVAVTAPIYTNHSTNEYHFFYQDETPADTGTDMIPVGSHWFNTAYEKTYIYIYDGESFYWIAMHTEDSRAYLPKFYYQDSSPNGTGTPSIVTGSTWFNTTNGATYMYIFDGASYFWVRVS